MKARDVVRLTQKGGAMLRSYEQDKKRALERAGKSTKQVGRRTRAVPVLG